jgi:uncharacterized protein (DUF488 family)
MRTTLLTLGYEKRTIEEFVRLLQEAAVDVLVDVRATAWSHKPGFSKSGLSTRLEQAGIEYVHARFAGNPKTLRRQASSHEHCLALYEEYISSDTAILSQFEQLVESLHAQNKNVCIACFERHPDDCHRSIIAGKWQQRGGRSVRHLAPEGCDRLVTA